MEGSLAALASPPSLRPTPDTYNRPDVRRAVIPSAGGLMNARSLARHYAARFLHKTRLVGVLAPRVRLTPRSAS